MPKKQQKKILTSEKSIARIKSCLRVDPKDPTFLHVEVDKIGSYLMREEGLKFSMTKFEKLLENEINKKLVGKAITEKMFDLIAKYANELAIYLTYEMSNIEKGRIDKINDRIKNKPRK